MAKIKARNQRLELRLTASVQSILQAAARISGRSVSEFVLESALTRAEEMLADQQRFRLTADQWTAFQAALDAPPTPTPSLRRLLREPSVFERGCME
jgi:uncharacterized protein (DUF1778 family)